MLKAFSIVYFAVIVLVVCDNWQLELNIHDVNALMTFLSLAFLALAFLNKEKKVVAISILPASLFVFLFYSAMSFYFSLNADLSIYPALKLISALFLAAALIYFLDNTETLRKALRVVYILAGILAASTIIEQFFSLALPFQQSSIPASRSFFVNPNFFGGYLVIHIPIGLFLYFRAANSFESILLGVGWILILVALFFSNSQGGQLAAGLQILMVIRYFLLKKETDKAILVGVGVLISFLIYFAMCKLILEPNLVTPLAEEELVPVGPVAFNNIILRLLYWLGAWRIFVEHWLVGSGLWTFMELYPQTGLERLPVHAHNIYLQTAAETGLIGLGLLLACLTILCFKLIHIYKKGDAKVAQMSIFIGLSLAGFLLHNITEYNWLSANFIYYFVFLVIAVEVLSRETEGHKSWIPWGGNRKIWSKVVLVFSVLGAYTIFQYYSYQRVISHDIPLTQSVEEWLAKTEEASKYCESCARPHFLSGMAHLENYRVSTNKQSLIQAEQEFIETVRRNPNDMGAYLKLADAKNLMGKFLEAKEYYKKATKDPRFRNMALAGYLSLLKKQSAARL
ncbi:MAG: O-antigen ligase family protein [Nitrospinae bacterium]|nr:O-antigen ligase family protein [Nitrospinota bacterium]MBL7019797.1 O-antigen ligase family protein [Nitrospinaceae bacterium]